MNAREYRQQLYRTRTHARPTEDFYDQRDSFATVYLTILPFIALEYMAEISIDVMPSGLVFPTGYLLFWAFYYTYYKPGYLEERLSAPAKWDLVGIPTVLMGVVIWFVKVTVVELSGFFFRTLMGGQPAAAKNERRQGPRSQWQAAQPDARFYAQDPHPPGSRPGSQEGTKFYYKSGHEGTGFHKAPPRPPPKPASALPKDIVHALNLLGLQEGADWNQIHKRYRELAKAYHPDLNREITDVGKRFMMVDAAYRKLTAAKAKHFPDKK